MCLQMEMVSKQHQLLAMPMLAEVLSWQGRVMHEPVAAPVANVLEKCAERLALLFTRYIQDMVTRSSQLWSVSQKSLRDCCARIQDEYYGISDRS